jgi:hypothetical protein
MNNAIVKRTPDPKYEPSWPGSATERSRNIGTWIETLDEAGQRLVNSFAADVAKNVKNTGKVGGREIVAALFLLLEKHDVFIPPERVGETPYPVRRGE